MESKRKPLYIPVKTIDSDDHIAGIGNKEIAILSMTSCIALAVGIAIGSMTNSVFGVGSGVILILTVFLVVKRDITNENLIKKAKYIKKFFKSQKKFEYRYSDFLKEESDKDDKEE